jgi:hypothetical protein
LSIYPDSIYLDRTHANEGEVEVIHDGHAVNPPDAGPPVRIPVQIVNLSEAEANRAIVVIPLSEDSRQGTALD